MNIAKKMALVLILISAVSVAVIVDSSDAAKAWANTTALAKCSEQNVDAVYTCSGNVVRVVSFLDGGGSTYYRQDGKVTTCPLVAPGATTAECQMFSTPNYCVNTPVCRGSTTPTQPEQQTNQTPTVPSTQNVTRPTQPASDQTAPSPIAPQPPVNTPPAAKPPSNQNTSAQNPVDNLLLIVVGLGLVSIIVLFTLFRNTLKD